MKKKSKDKEVARKQVGLKALPQLKHTLNPHFKNNIEIYRLLETSQQLHLTFVWLF